MGKRSNFERVERDFYPTPLAAVQPLIPHLPNTHFNYIEPCAGDGRLCEHLLELIPHAVCKFATDIQPLHPNVLEYDAFDVLEDYRLGFHELPDMVISNIPWNRAFLHPFIEACMAAGLPTWLLFDADWMHTQQSMTFMKYLSKIVSVGRVKWIEDSKSTGKDNCCWYLFKPYDGSNRVTEFHGRSPSAGTRRS